MEDRLCRRAPRIDRGAPQDPPIPDVRRGHAAAACARGLHPRAPGALPFAARLLPREARSLRRAPRLVAFRARPGARHVFPARRLRPDLVRAGHRVRASADDRARRRGDPDLRVLRRASARRDARAFLLREAGADAQRRRGAALQGLEVPVPGGDAMQVAEPGGRARLMRLAGGASVAVALTLILMKAWAYAASGSVAMLGSLADSLLDLAASLITLLAVRIALTPADREHRFGHGK